MESEVTESTECKLRVAVGAGRGQSQWRQRWLEEIYVVRKTAWGDGVPASEKTSLSRERKCLVRLL